MTEFTIQASYDLTGDQPEAVDALSEGVHRGDRYQTLLGVTGSGKTFTMANVIQKVKKPTLVIAHNKTLAAQLCNEFREFLPDNAVEYFVSYYDYYQPEAYVAAQDLYIEKDSSINDEIDRLRHAATTSLLLRRDVVIVASVSCIYGLGSPEEYLEKMVLLQVGQTVERDEMLRKLVDIQYARNDFEPARGKFRVRGDSVEIWPASQDTAIRVQLWGDEVEQIVNFDPVSGELIEKPEHVAIYPATHFVTNDPAIERSLVEIRREMEERCAWFEEHGKILEAHRLRQRTQYDMEMLREMGYCSGIENYSRILLGKEPGATPNCLLDYFPDDFLCFVDESHMSLPQIRAMSEGDKSRKQQLVDYGFRLPSALDNRPLRFDEFLDKVPQLIFVSATPGAVRAGQQRQHRRADHPPHGPHRPRGRGAAHRGADRRPHERDPPPRGQGPAGPGHHAHQAHGRGPHRLPPRERLQGALPAQRGRHAGAHPDRARPAAGGVRRPRRHQPAARGAGPPRGHAGRHPGRRQGGLPARPDELSSRPSAAPPATSTARSSCTPTR